VDFLFVTVDPDRDTPPILSQYVALFGPQITGLRGTPNQLFSLARRYRAVFSVTKPTATTPYAVTHSAAVYVFDGNGQAQFLIAGLDTDAPDISGIAADLRGVIGNPAGISVVDWLQNLITSG
jgi:protein SCO1/2